MVLCITHSINFVTMIGDVVISHVEIFEPGNVRAVNFKSKAPLSCSYMDRHGFILNGFRMFRVV